MNHKPYMVLCKGKSYTVQGQAAFDGIVQSAATSAPSGAVYAIVKDNTAQLVNQCMTTAEIWALQQQGFTVLKKP